MAEATLNGSLIDLHGKIGKLVYRRAASGKTIVTKCPDMSEVEWSPAQQAERQRMKEANAYAKAAMADPVVKAIYVKKAKKLKRQPYRVAVSDYYNGNNLLVKK